MTTYVMRGADRDVETPPALSAADARGYAQQWADELGKPVILFRDDDGRLQHVDNLQPRLPAGEVETGERVYLVIDPEVGPVKSFPRERAYQYAANTGSIVARADVVSLDPTAAFRNSWDDA